MHSPLHAHHLVPLGSAASYQMGLEDDPHSKWSYAAVPGLGLGAAKLIRASESGRSAPHEFPWSECAFDSVLQMNKVTGQDMGIAGMNFVCQIPVLIFASPFFFLHHSQIPSGWVPKFPSNSSGMRSEYGPQPSDPQCCKSWLSPWDLFSHWRSRRLGGDLSIWCYAGLGEDNEVNM